MFSEQGFWSISDRINKCPAAHWIHRDGFFFPSFLLLDAEKKNRSEYRLPRIAFRNNSKEDENLENVSREMFFFLLLLLASWKWLGAGKTNWFLRLPALLIQDWNSLNMRRIWLERYRFSNKNEKRIWRIVMAMYSDVIHHTIGEILQPVTNWYIANHKS